MCSSGSVIDVTEHYGFRISTSSSLSGVLVDLVKVYYIDEDYVFNSTVSTSVNGPVLNTLIIANNTINNDTNTTNTTNTSNNSVIYTNSSKCSCGNVLFKVFFGFFIKNEGGFLNLGDL